MSNDLQQRIWDAIEGQKKKAAELVESHGADYGTVTGDTTVVLQGWIKGIEDALGEIAVEIENLRAANQD